jgi:SAM-dependent methyltransferase
MELFGVKNLTGFGALVDVSAAILIVVVGTAGVAQKRYITAAVAAVAVGAIGFFSTQLDLLRMSSGVFRFGQFEDPNEVSVVFYRDGKTASISVTQNSANKRRSIRTNGKTDAALTFGDQVFAGPDEPTMVLAGAIPLAMKPDSTLVANIGFGSGLTTHMLLGSPTVTSVDSIEIERMMIEGARLFQPRNRRAYEDPRSHIHIDDAKTFFATHGKRYDVIVSEPSNPWVSGVSTLFSREFYAQVRRNLKPDGLLVQWIQSYDISVDLLATIFKALGSEYEDYVVYRAGQGDLLIIATPKGKVPELSERLFGFPGAKETLAYLGYMDVADLQGLRIASRSAIEPIFAQATFAMNSDYFPILDQNAPRARFRGDTASEVVAAREEPVPVLAILDTEVRMPLSRISTGTINRPARVDSALAGAEMIGVFLEGRSDRARTLSPQARTDALLARSLLDSCAGSEREWVAALGRVVGMSAPFLQRDDIVIVFDRVRASRCWRSLGDDLKKHVMLLEAINDRDASAMWHHGAAVLEQRIDAITRKNALHAAVSGALAAGHRAEARELWLRHSAKLPKPARDEFLSRLLAAHVAER